MEDFERSSVSRRDRVIACAAVAAALLLVLAVLPRADARLPETFGITVGLFGAAALATAVTAFLFWRQAALLGSLPLLLLACGYGYATVLLAAYVLALPGTLAPGPVPFAAPESIGWLFVAWHGGFAAALCGYGILRFRRLDLAAGISYSRVAAVAAVATAATALLAVELAGAVGPWLPLIDADGRPTPLAAPLLLWAALPVVGGVPLFALRRGRSSLVDLWTAIVLFVVGIDIALALIAPRRFSLAWYGERVSQFGAAIAMLVVLVAHVDRVLRHNAQLAADLADQAIRDALTGLPNRRGFDQRLAEAIRFCVRAHEPLAIVLIDIDHFKLFNDTYGHVAGDACLRRVAETLAEHTGRAMDTVARYGGEEFAVILPAATTAGARTVASRMRARIEELDIRSGRGASSPRVTISAGICVGRRPEDLVARALLDCADRALYAAKGAGRNRVVDADFPETALA